MSGRPEYHLRACVQALVEACHNASRKAGWWTDLATGQPIDPNGPRVTAEKVALIHSEASEMLEGDRKGLMDSHLPHRTAFECEAADLLIRLCDLAGAKRLDLGGALVEKMAYNAQRADHKLENRRAAGGKAY